MVLVKRKVAFELTKTVRAEPVEALYKANLVEVIRGFDKPVLSFVEGLRRCEQIPHARLDRQKPPSPR